MAAIKISEITFFPHPYDLACIYIKGVICVDSRIEVIEAIHRTGWGQMYTETTDVAKQM